MSKKISNSLIWRFNHELINIMVIKGRIHKDLKNFFRCIQNLIKLDNEFRWKIREIIIFRNKTIR